ncbi:hypothetical protein DFH09DRAFT_1360750 [Mycena vulgaris]|nr:hypothetical protein DFH09DRAFT_1360750 [Mycena vulgaris]
MSDPPVIDLDTAVLGVAMVLVMQYFRNLPRDPLSIRIMVGILGIVSTNHTIFSAILNYKYYITLVMLCSVYVVAFTAQMFYASRIWILTKKDWRYVVPVFLLAAGIAQTVLVAKVHLYSNLQQDTAPVSSTQSGAILACDLLLTAILCTVLRKSRTGDRFRFKQDDNFQPWCHDKLIFFVGMPGTFVFMMFILPSCHFYAISVCSMLISRESLQAELRGPNGMIGTFQMSNLESNLQIRDVGGNSMSTGTIHVSTSVLKWVDDVPDDRDDNIHMDTGKMTLRQGAATYNKRAVDVTLGSLRIQYAQAIFYGAVIDAIRRPEVFPVPARKAQIAARSLAQSADDPTNKLLK